MFFKHCSLLRTQRSLSPSLDENVCAKDGGKEEMGETALRLSSFSFSWSFVLCYQSLPFCARLCSVQKTKHLRRKRQHCSCEIQRAVHSPLLFNLSIWASYAWAAGERRRASERFCSRLRGYLACSLVARLAVQKKWRYIFVAWSVNVSRVGTVLKSPWILEGVIEKSLNFCTSPWKVLKFSLT